MIMNDTTLNLPKPSDTDVVYLTGSTGFVGQMIVKQCEANNSITKIYCPIRPKKDLSGEARFQSMFGGCRKCVFVDPEDPLPLDATLLLLNAYSVKFFTPVESIMKESVKPMMGILDQARRNKQNIKGIVAVSTAYVQPPLPFKRSPDNQVPFLLEDVCTASELYEDFLQGRMTWSDVTRKYSDKLLPYQIKNCYASSKNIMEHLMSERYPELPISIVRPSIVAPSRDGTYGYDVRSGFSLFINIAKHPVMRFPCSQGRLNLVLVEDVASDIVRAAQQREQVKTSGCKGHPIICSTSQNEHTPLECFQKLDPLVKRVRIDNDDIRSLLRNVELTGSRMLRGQKTSGLVRKLYDNYDMIMSETFDFPDKHGPVVDEAVTGAHMYYKQLASAKEFDEKRNEFDPKVFRSMGFVLGLLILGALAASLCPDAFVIQFTVLAATVICGVTYLPNLSDCPRFFRRFTHCFDYLWIGASLMLFNGVCDLDVSEPMKVPIISVGCATVALLLDSTYMKLFPKLIAKDKMELRVSLKDLWNSIQTILLASILFMALQRYDFVSLTAIRSWRSFGGIWLDFISMIMLNDYPILNTFHSWMHNSAWAFARVHKKHHEGKLGCQATHAFQFDPVDLVFEEGLAPPLYLLLRASCGYSATIPFASIILLTFQQIRGLHSCNPHSSFFLNPVLDYFFKVNIEHQLHHAISSRAHDNFTVIPLSHLWTSARRDAIMEYERVFGVDLGLTEWSMSS